MMRSIPCKRSLHPGPTAVFRTLISNCPKRKQPQSFCGKSHFTTTMHADRPCRAVNLLHWLDAATQRRNLVAVYGARYVRATHALTASRQCTSFTRHRYATASRSPSTISAALGTQRRSTSFQCFILPDDRMHGASPPSSKVNEMRPTNANNASGVELGNQRTKGE